MSQWTKALLIVLRIAIGWHFLYEGVWKIGSEPEPAVSRLSWYPLSRATAALGAACEASEGPLDPARVDTFYDDVVRGLGSRGRSLSQDQKARLGALRDGLKSGLADRAGCRKLGFDWLDLRDEVLQLSSEPADTGWSARSYLQASAGPLRPRFRALAGDVDGLDRLSPASAQAAIDRRHAEILRHYERGGTPFTSEQQEELAACRDELKAAIAATLAERPIATRIEDYRKMRERLAGGKGDDAPFSRERLDADRRKLDTIAGELLAVAEEPVEELSARARSLVTFEQLAAGPLPRPDEPGTRLDALVRWSLAAIGLCLILGLATPVAALAAALQLALFYLASPPWPHLPATAAGGHYLYVDRNLIELVAVLLVASTKSGRWLGLDGLVWKLWERRWARKSAEVGAETIADEPAATVPVQRTSAAPERAEGDES